jgi:hypothetical protein
MEVLLHKAKLLLLHGSDAAFPVRRTWRKQAINGSVAHARIAWLAV